MNGFNSPIDRRPETLHIFTRRLLLFSIRTEGCVVHVSTTFGTKSRTTWRQATSREARQVMMTVSTQTQTPPTFDFYNNVETKVCQEQAPEAQKNEARCTAVYK